MSPHGNAAWYFPRRHLAEGRGDRPAFPPARAVAITGRPERDRAMTAAWLARCGHGGLPLECRPADLAQDPATVADDKARAATSWGCTHFVASDAAQAVRIAAAG